MLYNAFTLAIFGIRRPFSAGANGVGKTAFRWKTHDLGAFIYSYLLIYFFFQTRLGKSIPFDKYLWKGFKIPTVVSVS